MSYFTQLTHIHVKGSMWSTPSPHKEDEMPCSFVFFKSLSRIFLIKDSQVNSRLVSFLKINSEFPYSQWNIEKIQFLSIHVCLKLNK